MHHSPLTLSLAVAFVLSASLCPNRRDAPTPLEGEPEAEELPAPVEVPPPPPPWEALELTPLDSISILTTSLLDAPEEPGEPADPGAQLFPEQYTEVPGVLTFRGNNLRDNAAYGRSNITERRLEKVWTFNTHTSTSGRKGADYKGWGGGAGWTGQPALVQWPAETRAAMNLLPQFAGDEDFVEVIQGSLNGRVYFLDLETGVPSREPTFHNLRTGASDSTFVDGGHPIKGSVSIDPRGYPILYFGQGLPEGRDFGFGAYSLLDGKRLLLLAGRDKQALRRWGAFDGSAIINRLTDTLFVAGENGLIYRVPLQTSFDPSVPSLTIDPQVERLRYAIEGTRGRKTGVETSLSVWKNLAWFADNSGGIVAFDTSSFEPIWAWYGEEADDTNASIVVEPEGDQVNLYIGGEIEYQEGRTNKAWLHRFDGLTGKAKWSVGYEARGPAQGRSSGGGIFSTPVLGKHGLDDRLFVTVAEIGPSNSGVLAAVDKATGKELWSQIIPGHGWATPVVIYDAEGKGYVVLPEFKGDLVLWDGATGAELDRLPLGTGYIEASPAFMNDMLVISTRGRAVHGIAIR